jgi:hypothetical protein
VAGGAESKQQTHAAPAATEAARPASWRAWAAALFSTRGLRYAAPVLALSLVAVVSFVALRSRDAASSPNTRSIRPQTEVAERRPGAGPAETTATTGTANDNQSGVLYRKPDEESGDIAAADVTARQPPSDGRGPYAAEPQPAPPVTTSDADAPPPAAAPVTPTGPVAPTEVAKSAPGAVAAGVAPPPAKSDGGDNNKERGTRAAEPVDEIAANEAAARRGAAQSRAGDVQMPDGGTRNQRRGADNGASNVYDRSTVSPPLRESERDDRGAGGSSPARRGRPITRGEQRAEEGETTRVGETRAAAGHRFRREGSAWVDVNYKPSMRSTGVRRGTEAFRALVADVPVVGRVAEQIAGEVVVVVGGRAYRIR